MLGVALAAASALSMGCAGADGYDRDGDPAFEPVEVSVETGSDPSIFGGRPDDDEQSAPGVVALRVGTGGTFELCSGALVAPNVVLTARHCVTKNVTSSVSCDENGRSANGPHVAGDEEPGTIGVYLGPSPSFAEEPAAQARAIVAPKGAYLCDSDIALVVLDAPIDGIDPLPVRLDAPADPGETIESVGYGQNDDDDEPIGTRFRKSGVAVLAQGRGVSDSNTPLGPHEFEVGKSICQGDSGGPAISEKTGAIIGVVSRGGSCDEDFGHIYTTTAGFDALFDEAFALAGGAPDAEPRTAPARVRSASSEAAIAEDPPSQSASCSASRAGSSPSGASGFAVVIAAAVVLATRRRRDA